jgi:Tfp pilus assembly protein PilO
MKIDISDKISLLFDKIDGNNRYYVFVGFLVFVFLLDYFFLMSPQLASLRKINPEIRTISDEINQTKGNMQKLDEYRKNLEQLSKKFDEANLRVKSRTEIPFILEHIASVASKTGVKIDQIMPDTLDQELLTENSQRKYYDLPIYMEARSGYHDLGRFLNSLTEDNISLRVGAFTIVATSDTRYHLVKLTFKATVFEDILP